MKRGVRCHGPYGPETLVLRWGDRRGRWLHQAEGTPASRKGEEEAARAKATRFFFDGRMRGRVHFFWSCFHLFHLFLAGSRARPRQAHGPGRPIRLSFIHADGVSFNTFFHFFAFAFQFVFLPYIRP
jgi:hypothetical protein